MPSAAAFVAGLIVRLPATVQRLLSGGRAVRLDGLELDADVQLGLTLLRFGGPPPLHTLTPTEARRELAKSAAAFAGPPEPVARVEALTLPAPGGPLPARLYVPTAFRGRPALLVYYHGGGWVVGDLDTHDAPCRFLAREAGVAVLAVDYRRAPEHKFPAGLDDALAAFRWATTQAWTLGIEPGRTAVGGDSAGGNLAAVVSWLTTRDGGTGPIAQLLFYPVTDVSQKHPSYRLFAEGFFLTERDMDWYCHHYLSDVVAGLDPRVSPLLAPDLHGLPPTVILTAGFDVLRDEGEAYARRLSEAGVRVHHRRIAGQIHGFANTTAFSPSARAAMVGAAAALAQLVG